MRLFRLPVRLAAAAFLAALTLIASAQYQVPVGTTSAIQTVLVNIPNPNNSYGPPQGMTAYVLTSGNPNGDFQLAPNGPNGEPNFPNSCVGGNQSSFTCSVFYTVTPSRPGAIQGAIQVVDQNSNILATNYLKAIGTGPQLAFVPTTPTALQAGFNGLVPIAVDGSGNIYVGDYSAGTISEITNPGTANQQKSVLVSNPALYPKCLTVMGDGTIIYGGSAGGNGLYMLQSVGGVIPANATPIKITNGVPCNGMVADAGSVWIGEFANGLWTLDSTYFTNGYQISGNLNLIAQNVGSVGQLALDPAGDVYFFDSISESIKVLNNATLAVTTVAQVDLNTYGLAVDAAGDLFKAGYFEIDEYFAVNGTIPGNPTIFTRYLDGLIPQGIVSAPNGDLLFAGSITQPTCCTSGVFKLDYQNGPSATSGPITLAPAYSFANTIAGATSSDSPYTFTLLNNGNQPLFFGNDIDPYGSGNTQSYLASANFSIANSSTCPVVAPYGIASLAAGSTCTFTYSFHPSEVSPASASYDIITNSLNGSSYYGGVNREITLFGTGTAPPTIPITVTAANITVAAGSPASTSVVSLITGFTAPGYNAQQIEAMLSSAEFGVTISGNGYSQNYPIFQNGSFVGATLLPAVPANEPATTYTVTPYLTGSGASQFTFTPVAGSITITAAPTTQPLSITAANITVHAGATPTQTVAQLMASYSAPGLTGVQLAAEFSNCEVGFTVTGPGFSQNIPLFSYGTYYGANLLQMVPAGAPTGTFTLTPYLTGPGASKFNFSETPGSLTIANP